MKKLIKVIGLLIYVFFIVVFAGLLLGWVQLNNISNLTFLLSLFYLIVSLIDYARKNFHKSGSKK